VNGVMRQQSRMYSWCLGCTVLPSDTQMKWWLCYCILLSMLCHTEAMTLIMKSCLYCSL